MNVRWDAVVGQDTFWTTPASVTSPTPPSATQTPATIPVEVCLYGMLSVAQGQRTLRFELPGAATLADVVAELRGRLDPAALEGIIGEHGQVQRCCRVFLNGAQAEDPATPIRSGAGPATVEIILLVAAEGG